jgi:hypothetical protein
MSLKTYKQFSDDLLRLYCVTKNSKIEQNFIRFSEAYNNEFCKWIQMEEKKIRPKLKEQNLLQAFKLLCEINITDKNSITKLLLQSPTSTKAIPLILSLNDILEKSSFSILQPFTDAIKTVRNLGFKNGTGTEYEELKKSLYIDLQTLTDLYTFRGKEEPVVVKAPSKKQERQDIAQNLLEKFSSEIALAFEQNGMVEIAQAFRNKVLARPVEQGIAKILPIDTISPDKITVAYNLANYVWKSPSSKWIDYYHDYVESVCLNRAGVLSDEDFWKIKKQYDQFRGTSLLEEDYKVVKNLEKNAIMNPEYIHMVALFFYFLQNKMSTL